MEPPPLTLNFASSSICMAEFSKAQFLGKTLHFKMKMGANSLYIVQFGLVWFGLEGMNWFG